MEVFVVICEYIDENTNQQEYGVMGVKETEIEALDFIARLSENDPTIHYTYYYCKIGEEYIDEDY